MTEYFSPLRGGFFDDRFNPEIPADAIALVPGQRQSLFEALNRGDTVTATKSRKLKTSRPRIDLDLMRNRMHAAVKREASRRILAIAPMWQQLNDLRALAADQLEQGEEATRAGALARGASIDAVRAASNALDAAIDTMGTRALAQLDVTSACHWPPHQAEPAPEPAPTPETAS